MVEHPVVTMDYELMEDPERKTIEDKAMRASCNNHTAAMNLPMNLSGAIVNTAGFLLVGGLIAYLSPWIVVLLVISAGVNCLALAWLRCGTSA